MIRKFGWKRDVKNARDVKYTPSKLRVVFPPSIDLRPNCTAIPIYDQGNLSSCTANAACFAYRYTEMIQALPHIFSPSRLFLYYNTRDLMGTTNIDSGASLRDTMIAAETWGVCSEAAWKYDITQFTTKPPQQYYDQAATAKVLTYMGVTQDLVSLKTALMEGNPIMFGFDVYSSFMMIGSDGIMPIPAASDTIIGGHAVTIVGYDDSIKFSSTVSGGFIVRNSWGPNWGQEGYFYMNYDYALNPIHAGDFWIIKSVMASELSDVIPEPNPYMDINVNVSINSLIEPDVIIGNVTLVCNGQSYVLVKP